MVPNTEIDMHLFPHLCIARKQYSTCEYVLSASVKSRIEQFLFSVCCITCFRTATQDPDVQHPLGTAFIEHRRRSCWTIYHSPEQVWCFLWRRGNVDDVFHYFSSSLRWGECGTIRTTSQFGPCQVLTLNLIHSDGMIGDSLLVSWNDEYDRAQWKRSHKRMRRSLAPNLHHWCRPRERHLSLRYESTSML